MTNKITLEALKLAGFKNPNAIAEILNYVPNPNVALEMLLEVYEPRVVDENRFFKYRHSDDVVYEITAYDELGNKVFYNEYRRKYQRVYYVTEEDRKNKVYVTEKPEKYYDSGNIPTDGYTITTDSRTGEFDNSYNKLNTDEFSNILSKWNNKEFAH